MIDRVFLDTNILVYAYDKNEPKKQIRAQDILKAAIEEESGIISAQILGEFFVVVTRRIKEPLPIDDAEKIIDIISVLPVAEIDKNLVRDAINIQKEYGISYWDSLIVATAKREGCDRIITEDLNSGQNYDGVLIENPF